MIGALIMSHGDQNGLVLPPTVAPTQIVLMPVGPWKKNPGVMEKLDEIFYNLKEAGYRVRLDDSDNTPGYKFNEWELKGACIRIECGPRDIENGHVIVKSRDVADKQKVAFEEIDTFVADELTAMTPRLLEKARKRVKENEYLHINTLQELKEHIETCKEEDKTPGFVLIGWDGTEETEETIKEETGFTTRNIPFEAPMEKEVDIVSGKPAKHTLWIARAY
ncbi:prolyl-tRNA synthetase [Tetragenococcus muriaticus PMC-11-5]|uniref:proline--tRNA ligase n=1 Tax=Tetragenococcus muriaticus PMC-11-5 TaxID=1302649 RepID=A0A091C940_9ENTE|nr:prolyl-tRNA synthetase [Tetragenococcus muriaticus PMC-11-5]